MIVTLSWSQLCPSLLLISAFVFTSLGKALEDDTVQKFCFGEKISFGPNISEMYVKGYFVSWYLHSRFECKSLLLFVFDFYLPK